MFRIGQTLKTCKSITFNKNILSKRLLSTTTEHVVHEETKHNKKLAYWLLGVGGLVVGIVTVGGITRLTRSGLSMTDWRIHGSLPPITKDEWDIEFERYKTFPEWQQRKSMTLEEFKFIYFWEYSHRMMGRFIGLAFAGPLMYFSYKKMIPKSLYPRLGLLFGLGGTQGLIGWWMVKSGLDIDPTTAKKEIRVSPYRLTTHLAMAFTTYTTLIWTAMDLLNPPAAAKEVASKLSDTVLQQSKKFKRFAIFNGVLAATTILSGAFVAGNDAGHAYNSFPMMGDHWIPPEVFEMSPMWRNFFENTALVQFDHRVLALSTLSGVTLMYFKAKYSNPEFWKSIPAATRRGFVAVNHMGWLQVGLGISTLLLYVPIPLAACHQAGSLVLLSLITYLTHSLKYTKYITKLIK